ncbi:MAG: PPOX class F420-dependent oxidoreductase [Actinomycetota bacterium]|nr:PPOX class F420-dependent oxidoreductase [Actinomycetota bacterium]
MSAASVVSWVARLGYRSLERMRHPDAFRIAGEPGTAPDLEGLRGHHYCLLVTFKRSGEPIPSPVLFGLAGGRLYVRTERGVGKVKRIRSDPHVRVGPCDPRGKPLGPSTEARARVVPAGEEGRAYAALKANYTRSQRLLEEAIDRIPVGLVYLEVIPRGGEGG